MEKKAVLSHTFQNFIHFKSCNFVKPSYFESGYYPIRMSNWPTPTNTKRLVFCLKRNNSESEINNASLHNLYTSISRIHDCIVSSPGSPLRVSSESTSDRNISRLVNFMFPHSPE